MSQSRFRDRRHRILAEAERLFRCHGLDQTRVGDIARACGIAVGSVYLEFRSKEAIVGALRARRCAGVVEAMRAAAGRPGGARERLAAVLEARMEAYFRLADESTHGCELLLEARGLARSDTLAEALRMAEGELTVVREVLGDGHAAGDLIVPDLEEVSRTIEWACASFAPALLLTVDRDLARRRLHHLAELLGTALGAARTAGPSPLE